MKYLALLFFIPFLGISQNYKLVDKDYPEIAMKKIENDTVGAKLITSKSIIDGYVVYRQIKRLDIDKVYRFPESFFDEEMKSIEGVLYYEAEKILQFDNSFIWQEDLTPNYPMNIVTDSNGWTIRN